MEEKLRGRSTAYYDPAKRLSSEDLGIGDRPDYPTGYLAQLGAPFRRDAV